MKESKPKKKKKKKKKKDFHCGGEGVELEPVIFFYKESKSKIKKWVLGGMCVCVFFFGGGGGVVLE